MIFRLSDYQFLCDLTLQNGKLKPEWDAEFKAKKMLAKQLSLTYVIVIGDDVYKIGKTDRSISAIVNEYCRETILADRMAHRKIIMEALTHKLDVKVYAYFVETPVVPIVLQTGEQIEVTVKCGAELEKTACALYKQTFGSLPRGNHLEKSVDNRRAS